MESNKKFPILETERLILRVVELKDAEDIFEYASDAETTQYMPFASHTSIQNTYDFINFKMAEIEEGKCLDFVLVLKENNKVIGTGGASNISNLRCVNVGYIINKKYWGKGLVVEAMSVVIKYLFNELDVHRIEAYHIEENYNSGKVMKKLGMQYEGTLKDRIFREQYHNAVYYGLINPNHSKK